jgi:hypothetical protein
MGASAEQRRRSLKVETRVRTPLGVLTVKPQVGTAFVALTWRFLVSRDHPVVSGSCHTVQPMMGRGPEIVLRLCSPAAPRSDDNPPARPPVAKGGRRPWCREVIRSTVAAHGRDRCGRRLGVAAVRLGSIFGDATLRARRSSVPAPLLGSRLTSRRSAARGTTTRRPSLMLGSSPPRTSW